MAKSKNGGTRAYIRGRIGSDVYSIGKDAKGKKQQVVRALAEQVANPQTVSQMRGRMIMSTVMQAVSAMSLLIDHSFDGLTKGQPSISEFIARNYQLVKADVAANPASGNKFGLNQYQQKGIQVGAWLVSDGKEILPAALSFNKNVFTVALSADALTIAGLKAALAISGEEYITIMTVTATAGFSYSRFSVKASLADSTVISASNVADVFDIDGNVAPVVALSGNSITLTLGVAADVMAFGAIVSRSDNGGFKHSRCVLTVVGEPVYTADTALPTYPIGTQLFLNGGSLSGQAQASSAAGGSTDSGSGSGDNTPSVPDEGGE